MWPIAAQAFSRAARLSAGANNWQTRAHPNRAQSSNAVTAALPLSGANGSCARKAPAMPRCGLPAGASAARTAGNETEFICSTAL